MITTAMLFTYGASRGNPGPAAVAYRIIDADGALVDARAERIANATNNEAEYAALTAGLEAGRRLGNLSALSASPIPFAYVSGMLSGKSGSPS